MPIRRLNPNPSQAPEAPSFFDKVRSVGAAGTRAVTGALSAEGGLSGALISGAGELGAEALEGDLFDQSLGRTAARTGVAAGVGAVPFGAVLKAGRPFASAARGALYSGAGEAGREIAKNNEINPTGIGIAAATGGLLNAGLAKILGIGHVAPVPEVEPPAPTGFNPDKPTANLVNPRTNEIVKQANVPAHTPLMPPKATGGEIRSNIEGELSSGLGKLFAKAPVNKKNVLDLDKGIQQAGKTGQTIRDQVLKDLVDEAKGQTAATTLLGREAKEADKAATEAAARQEIEDAITNQGLIRQPPSVSESGSIKTPTGRQRFNARYAAPEEEGGGEGELDPYKILGVSRKKAPDTVEYDDAEGNAPSLLGEFLKVKGPSGRTATVEIPPGGRAREIYDAWIEKGMDPARASKLAAKGTSPLDAALEGQVVPQPTLPEASSTPSLEAPAAPEPPSLDPIAQGREIARQAAIEKGQPVIERALEGPEPPSRMPQSSLMDDYMKMREGVGLTEEELPGEASKAGNGTHVDEPVIPDRGGVAVEEPLRPIPGSGLQYGGPDPANLSPDLGLDKFESKTDPYSGGSGIVVDGVTPEIPEEPHSVLAKLFKSRVDAAGQNYRAIKEALGAGESKLAEPTGLLDERGRPMSASNIAGAGLAREGKAAGLPPTPKAASEPKPPKPPTAAPTRVGGVAQTSAAREAAAAARKARVAIDDTTTQQVSQLEEAVNGLKAAGKSPEEIRAALPGLLDRMKGESGAASPAMLARLALAGIGGLAGGIAGGSGGHPLIGAALGASAGALGPDMIMKVLRNSGATPEHLEGFQRNLGNPEAIKESTHNLIAALPAAQRFNLLFSLDRLPANIWFGPWGSAFMEGVERSLNSDPIGPEIIKRLGPASFFQRWRRNLPEAGRLIEEGEMGRMEGRNPLLSGKAGELVQSPGKAMTAGDLASRELQAEAGVPEELTRAVTLTSEPELKATQTLANMSKGSPLLQILQPFPRTTANIAEQGAHRIPLLGFLTQSYRENPDPMKLQIIQQLLGLGVGATSYGISSNLSPENARLARSYVTNAAGRYALPASIGFTAGQATAAGKDPLSTQTLMEIPQSLPLPATAPLRDWADAATTGNPPRGAVPAVIRDLEEIMGSGAPANTPGPATRPSRFRR